jgi:hypothetical protein
MSAKAPPMRRRALCRLGVVGDQALQHIDEALGRPLAVDRGTGTITARATIANPDLLGEAGVDVHRTGHDN